MSDATTFPLPSVLQLVLGLYGYLLPLLLYTLWTTLALWDIGHRKDLSPGAVWGWTLIVFLLPFLGPLVYLSFGHSQVGRTLKLVSVAGGAGLYVAVLLVGWTVGGIS
jgi:hypothetical protein